MPWHDWQFWVVTVAMVACFAQLLRQVFPRRGASSCPSCATGAAACAKKDAQPSLVKLGRH